MQPFFGFRNTDRLILNARAIRAPEPKFEASSFWRGLATMVGLYASHEVPGLVGELEYRCADGTIAKQQATSGPEGFMRFDLDISAGCDRAERTRWERATVRWADPDDLQRTGEAEAFILTPGEKTRIGVISDIDDTILETGITGNLRAIARNWKRVIAQMPSERAVVPGASDFYTAIGGDAMMPPAIEETPPGQFRPPRARVRPVFYVSSSPWNLFSYLVTFKRHRGLPLGPVMLRDWGFNRRTLGKEGHGSHKHAAIMRILEAFPKLRFALIGDDSQKDLVAFGKIAAEHPERVAAVFIRSVSGEPLSAEEIAARDAIEAASVPFWTGADYAAAQVFLESNGLDFEGGVERLVRTASEGDPPDEQELDDETASSVQAAD
ncbi:MAG: phosphatase domain-containing protein, partial [Erythrobacter sp.]